MKNYNKLSVKSFLHSVETYVTKAAESERIPNLAGYLRFMSMSKNVYEELCKKYPEASELIDLIFEDEALNANTKKISSSVLNLYIKERFGYGAGEGSGGGDIKVICNHEDYE